MPHMLHQELLRFENDDTFTSEFIQKHNDRLSQDFPDQPHIKDAIKAGMNYERFSAYTRQHGFDYYTYNSGLMDQSILIRENAHTKETVLDPNQWGETTQLKQYTISPNGKYIAYSTSESGSDWVTIHGMDLSTKASLGELPYCKFTAITWSPDSEGVLVQQFPEPDSKDLGTETDKLSHPFLVYFNWTTTKVIHKDDHPDYMFTAMRNYNDSFYYLMVHKDCNPYNLLYKMTLDFQITPIFTEWDYEYDPIFELDGMLYLKTNQSENYRLVQYDGTTFKTMLERPYKLNNCSYCHNHLIVEWLHQAQSKIEVYDLQFNCIKTLAFDGTVVSVSSMGFNKHTPIVSILVKGFICPGTLYELHLDTMDMAVKRSVEYPFSLQGTSVQEWFTASDGVQVPYFLSDLGGSGPIYLYGYGGFNISLEPFFSSIGAAWMRHMEGRYCVVNIRGGGEFGELWHAQGTRLNKKRSFQDFIECAQHLKAKHNCPIVSHGGSNGGLLTAASAILCPSAFDVVLSDVGVMDMLRFHKFTIGHAWISDYGDPDDPAYTDYLASYSPAHNKGQDLPYTLCCTSDHDDRVVPHHSYKFVYTQDSDKVYLRTQVKSGHGASSLSKAVEEWTTKYSFVCKALGMKWK